eukprot:gene1665-1854_t
MSRGEDRVSDAPPQPMSRPSAIVDQSVHMPDLQIPQKFVQSCDLSVSPEDTITTQEDLHDSESNECHLTSYSDPDATLEKQFRQYINRDFCESNADNRKAMSIEDKRALAALNETSKLVDGHYQPAIPWRNVQPCLPNNRPVAEHRLKYLKRKLSRDAVLCEKYTNFINDLLVKNHARKVPGDQRN